jgi:acyl-CoA synthetase (AMP-forming)/AMP-acid ligase II
MLSKKFNTLIGMLEVQADLIGDKLAFTFLHQPVTYSEMWDGISRFGAYLQDLGMQPGDRVVLALPNSAEFFSAFYGIQRAGGTAVPIFPGSGIGRIFSLATICGAEILVAPSSFPDEELTELNQKASSRGMRVVKVSESTAYEPEGDFPEIHPEDIAFLQYTSGSTGNPKGVMLSHDNLLTNIVQMIIGMEISETDIFVSWLPVYHDMGLILKTMAPFYLGFETHLLPTDLRDVRPWLDAIQKYKGTFTAAPDFAYRLCVRHVESGDYDLSSLRVALNAAEPVRARTIQEFETAFGLKSVMVAGYGLAEATVGVSMWKPGSTPKVDQRGFVSVGFPFPEVEVRIKGEDGFLPAGEIGEILIHSPANSRGYYLNPTETESAFTEEGFLRSGDLGYLDEEGYLYIISRKKNIIKRSGETISPAEIEEIVDLDFAVRYSAALGMDRGGTEGEQIYIFAEIRDGEMKTEDDLFYLSLEVVNAIHARMGYRPGRVYLLKARSIPLTHNGKVQHSFLKEMYLEGSLRDSGMIIYPEY